MIKAVIFDMDGVLIDSEPKWFKVEEMLFKKYNVVGNPIDVKSEIMSLSDVNTLKLLKKKFNIPAEIEEMQKFRWKVLLELYEEELTLRKGAQKLLDYIKKNNIPCALATSSPPIIVDFVLKKTKIRNYFQSIITVDKVRNSKPAPDMFLKAAEELNIDPKNCLVLEDAPNGIKAAKEAGMQCIGVLHSFNSKKDLVGAFKIVDELTEINLKNFINNN